jgi:hypothetical protein
MCRFWLENEIWFAGYKEAPMPDACQEYMCFSVTQRAFEKKV